MIDTHTHLQSYTTRQLLHSDTIASWQEAWAIAQQSGVTAIMNIFDISDATEIVLIPEMKQVDEIYIAAAVHPCNIHNITQNETQIWLEENIHMLNCIGETGIDIYNNQNDLQTQIEYLLIHLNMAQKHKKPVCLHYRNDNTNNVEFINILMNIMRNYKHMTFVMHCCTFDWQYIAPLVAEFDNCYVSISGIVTYSKALDVHNLARNIPLNRLLIETDSPFLTPQAININRFKQNNHSGYITHVYAKVAELRNMQLNLLIEHVANNFARFLNTASTI